MKFYLVFCKNITWYNFLGKAIIYLDGKDCSHCEIKVIDFEGDSNYFGAVWPFSRLANEKEFKAHYAEVRAIELKVDDYKKAIADLNKQMAKPYSLMQILASAAKIFAKAFLKATLNLNLNGSKHLICTELCADFIEDRCGIKMWENKDTITISDLKEKMGVK